MSPALLMAALAHADPAYDRLFGPPDAETAPPAAVAAPAAELPPWIVPVGLLGGIVAMGLHLRRRAAETAPGRLRIVQREPTGDRGSLLLVEVVGEGGERRRLLVGTGNGPPVLVADLGEASAPEAPAEAPAVAASAAERASFASRLAEEVLAERRAERSEATRARRYFQADELAPLETVPPLRGRLTGEAVLPPRRVAR